MVPGKRGEPYAGTMEPLIDDLAGVRRQMRWASVAAVALLVATILLFTLSPGGSLTSGSRVIDEIAEVYGTRQQASWLLHAGLFGLFGVSLSLWFASSSTSRGAPRRALGMLVLAVWIFAAATELAQGGVDGREASLGDWVADMVGVLAGLLLAPIVLRPVVERLIR